MKHYPLERRLEEILYVTSHRHRGFNRSMINSNQTNRNNLLTNHPNPMIKFCNLLNNIKLKVTYILIKINIGVCTLEEKSNRGGILYC